jgi:hypothetical protein
MWQGAMNRAIQVVEGIIDLAVERYESQFVNTVEPEERPENLQPR